MNFLNESELDVVRSSVLDSLPVDLSRNDSEIISNFICNYVATQLGDISDSMRYEGFYKILNSAKAIAQGWGFNCASNVSGAQESLDSLKTYIENTYGSQYHLS